VVSRRYYLCKVWYQVNITFHVLLLEPRTNLWQVYFLVCRVNKFPLTNFLDKFTFSCVQSTSFPWQVFLWQVYFLVCMVNKFSLTNFLDKFTFSCVGSTSFLWQISLTSLLSRVYSQQVFLDKFTFSCVGSTGFLWQISLTSLLSRVHSQQVFLWQVLLLAYTEWC
jgi:hypothetical protein